MRLLDVSPLCSPNTVFPGTRINASRLAARYISIGAARSIRPFARPQQPEPLSSSHSGVNVPGLHLRVVLPLSFPRPFGSSAPQPPFQSRGRYPRLFDCGCFYASSPLRLPLNGSASCFRRSPLPLGTFRLPQDQSVQPLSPPAGSPDDIARLPLAPRDRFYF